MPVKGSYQKSGMSNILVAKPTDHKILFEWVDELTGSGDGNGFEIKDSKGKKVLMR